MKKKLAAEGLLFPWLVVSPSPLFATSVLPCFWLWYCFEAVWGLLVGFFV